MGSRHRGSNRESSETGQSRIRLGRGSRTLPLLRLLPTLASVLGFPEAVSSSGLGSPPYVTPLTNFTSLFLSLFVCGRVFAICKCLKPCHTEIVPLLPSGTVLTSSRLLLWLRGAISLHLVSRYFYYPSIPASLSSNPA